MKMIYLGFCYLFGYSFYIFVGQRIIKNIMVDLRKGVKPYIFGEDAMKAYGGYASIVGYLEGILYVTSLLLNYPQFIAVWLGFKIAGRWASPELERSERKEALSKTHPTLEQKLIMNNGDYNNFTIGNALSIIYAVGGWKATVWLKSGHIIRTMFLVIIIVMGSYFVHRLVNKQNNILQKLFSRTK